MKIRYNKWLANQATEPELFGRDLIDWLNGIGAVWSENENGSARQMIDRHEQGVFGSLKSIIHDGWDVQFILVYGPDDKGRINGPPIV